MFPINQTNPKGLLLDGGGPKVVSGWSDERKDKWRGAQGKDRVWRTEGQETGQMEKEIKTQGDESVGKEDGKR